MTTRTLQEKAAATAALLDECEPAWAERIDLESLRMSDPYSCLIGQLKGDYFTADLRPLGYRPPLFFRRRRDPERRRQWGVKAGLNVPPSFVSSAHYAELRAVWSQLVRERTGAQAAGSGAA